MNTNILDYGAVEGGTVLCTDAINAAIEACASTGGGRVTVPAGLYQSGTIWLKSGVELHLEHNSVIRGSDNMDDYNPVDAYEQNMSSPVNEKWLGKHLLIALECENVAVTGTGTFDGNGDFFLGEAKPWSCYVWKDGCRQARDPELCRPGQLFAFVECKRVLVENVTLTNQPCWGCFLHGCEYVTIRGLQTRNPTTFFNSDGIDIDCCRYVTVSDCIIDTGDDCIAIRGSNRLLKDKKDCEYITITNCVLGSSSSTFRLGVGTGAIRHVRVSNITVTRGAPAIQIMSSYMRKGSTSIEDVSFSNLSMTNCARVMEITECSAPDANVRIRDITVENVRAETYGYVHLNVENPTTVENINLRNWQVILTDGPKPIVPKCYERRGTVWFRGQYVKDLTLSNFKIQDPDSYLSIWQDGLFNLPNCENLKFENVTLNGKAVEA